MAVRALADGTEAEACATQARCDLAGGRRRIRLRDSRGSHYQQNLEALCGGRIEDGAHVSCVAFLVPEPDNRFDSNAVRVELMPETGGKPKPGSYLFRDDAPDYHEKISDFDLSRRVACCHVVIVGGWDGGKQDRGHFGVKLDLLWPVERRERPT